MTELTLPLRGLIARPLRTLLTVLGIALAVAGFVALSGLTAGVQRSFASGIDENGADLVVSQRSTFNLVSSTVPRALGPALSAVPNVEAVSGVLLNITTADEDANIVMAGWPSGSFLWKDVPLVAGRLPVPGDPWPVILGQSIAGALDKRVGDTVELQFQPYRIVGIASFSSMLNQNSAIVPLEGLQQLLSREDAFTLFEVRLKRPLDADGIAAARTRLVAAAPGFVVVDTEQFANSIRIFDLLRAIARTISLVVMAMASVAVANTLLMAVNERTFEIGVLAALGWAPRRILRLILIEGVFMSAAGGVIGIVLGALTMEAAAKTRVAAGLIVPYLSGWSIAQALIFVFIAGPLGALYPAWRATRLLPAEALRRI
ncbi:ABC transporter permease [Mesorhizobium sp. CA6]|uniref:ABC transporter permease n=1 Tax=Mesorhizobium sp. CA6 TaxID=588500 RepID=UPI001CCDF49E|nr:ABC transporter permease [Mesorhizobium sp. CA6]MBZ9767230.1 ABC transporter permease [Mesorhizobium sp. CA6]